MSARGFCAVVEASCKAPPAFSNGIASFPACSSTKVATRCYVCGDHVCTACSRFIVMGRGKNCRVCLTCKPKGGVLAAPTSTGGAR